MKLFLTLLVFLLSCSFVSAASLDVYDTEYFPGETVQVFIADETVVSSSISVLDGSMHAVSVIPLFTEYREGETLLYFTLPTSASQGNYTLLVGNLAGNFSVVEGSPVFSLNPGYIVLDDSRSSFSLTVTSFGEGGTVVISSSDSVLRPRKSSVSIGTDESKTLYVDYTYSSAVEDMSLTLVSGNSSYTVPVIYPGFVEETFVNETENVTESNGSIETSVVLEEEDHFVFLVTQEEVLFTLSQDQSKYGDLKVQNLLNETLTNLTFSLTGTLDLLVRMNETLITLGPGEIYSQRLFFNEENNSRIGNYSGLVVLTDEEGYTQNLSFVISVVSLEEEEDALVEENVLENQTTEAYTITYEGETLAEESGNGVYYLGAFLSILLLALIVLVVMKLRQKDERKFNDYIEQTKRK